MVINYCRFKIMSVNKKLEVIYNNLKDIKIVAFLKNNRIERELKKIKKIEEISKEDFIKGYKKKFIKELISSPNGEIELNVAAYSIKEEKGYSFCNTFINHISKSTIGCSIFSGTFSNSYYIYANKYKRKNKEFFHRDKWQGFKDCSRKEMLDELKEDNREFIDLLKEELNKVAWIKANYIVIDEYKKPEYFYDYEKTLIVKLEI